MVIFPQIYYYNLPRFIDGDFFWGRNMWIVPSVQDQIAGTSISSIVPLEWPINHRRCVFFPIKVIVIIKDDDFL